LLLAAAMPPLRSPRSAARPSRGRPLFLVLLLLGCGVFLWTVSGGRTPGQDEPEAALPTGSEPQPPEPSAQTPAAPPEPAPAPAEPTEKAETAAPQQAGEESLANAGSPKPLGPRRELIRRSRWGPLAIRDTVTLKDGSFAIAGSFFEPVVFGPGTERELRYEPRKGETLFVAKYGPDESFLWAQFIEVAPLVASITKDLTPEIWLAALPEGGVALAASPCCEVEIRQGPTTPAVKLTNTGIFGRPLLARYGSDGSLEWVRWAQVRGAAQARGVAALSDGSLVLLLNYSGSMAFQPGGAPALESTLYPSHSKWAPGMRSEDIAWVRWSVKGEPLGFHQVTGPLDQRFPRMAAFADDSLLITGLSEGKVNFVPGDAGTLDSGEQRQSFLARYGTDGTLHWRKALGNTWGTHVNDALALSEGGVAVVGRFHPSAGFGEGAGERPSLLGGDTDLFVARYSPEGALAWLRTFGTPSGESPIDERLEQEPDGTLVVRGVIERTALFQGAQTRRELTPRETAGRPEGQYMARYSPAGALLSAELGDGPWPWPPWVGCCLDSSIAESARKVPEPFIARDLGSWVEQMLGGVQLERTRQEELDGVIELDGERVPFGNDRRYTDWRGRFPGQSVARPRSFYTREGVVRKLSIGQIAADASLLKREELRAKLGLPYEVEGGIVDRYCNPPGHPGLAVYFFYEGQRSTLQAIDIMGPHQSNPCLHR
jgi:hypothetical protein